jgi:hypothetical protein
VNTARTTSLAEVDDEIEARKAKLRSLKEEHAKRNGVAHPDKAPKLDLALVDAAMINDRPAEQRISATEQKILDAAARIALPGHPPRPSAIAATVGGTPTRVSVVIAGLRKKNLWPYERCSSAPNPPGAKSKPKRGLKPEAVESSTLKSPEPTPGIACTKPYPGYVPNLDPKADPEILVIQRIIAQLDRLPSWHARRRVLAYLDSRDIEMEVVEP